MTPAFLYIYRKRIDKTMKINYRSNNVGKIVNELSEVLRTAFSDDEWEMILNDAYPERAAWEIAMEYLEEKGFLSYLVTAAVFRML